MKRPKTANAEKPAPSGAMIRVSPDPDRPFVVTVERAPGGGRSKATDDFLLRRAFSDRPVRSYSTKKRFLAEGDSWINFLTDVPGQPDSFVDVIAGSYYVNNIGWPGDTFAETFAAKQYRQPLQSGTFDYFIFSGGGVDFFGGNEMRKYVCRKSEGGGSGNPADYVKPEFKALLAGLKASYTRLVKEVAAWGATRTRLVMQGYDYSIPVKSGQYLGRRFEALGYDVASGLPRAIVRELVDRFNAMLQGVADKSGGRAIALDFRGRIGTQWHDEIHPNQKGADRLGAHALKTLGLKA